MGRIISSDQNRVLTDLELANGQVADAIRVRDHSLNDLFTVNKDGEVWTGNAIPAMFHSARFPDGSRYADVQAAMDDVATTIGKVFVPVGTYTENLTLKSGMILEGSGHNTIIKRASSYYGIHANNINDFIVRNLRGQGDAAGFPSCAYPVFEVRGNCQNFILEHLWSEDVAQNLGGAHCYSIDADDDGAPAYGVLRSCYGNNPGDDCISILGNALYQPHNINIENCRLTGTLYGSNSGVEIESGAHDVSIIGCSIHDCAGRAINMHDEAGINKPPYNVIIANNLLSSETASAASGCYIYYDADSQMLSNLIMTGNILEQKSNYPACIINDLKHGIFVNNIFKGNAGTASEALRFSKLGDNPCSDILINGNIFDGFNTDAINLYSSIANARFLIKGNRFTNNRIGIMADAAGSGLQSEIVIDGNAFYSTYDNATGGNAIYCQANRSAITNNSIINDVATTAVYAIILNGVADCLVSGNSLTDCNNGGIYLSASNRCLVNGNIGRETKAGANRKFSYLVRLVSGSDYNQVSNNMMYNSTVSAPFSAGTGTNNRLSHNMVIAGA